MIEMIDGVVYVEGEPEIVLSADYPYYRDEPQNWEDRIVKLKRAGLNTITFYIPWRHHHIQHKGNMVYDFAGVTKSNRNVLRFISILQKHGLYAIVKPGPFIHAETDFGGLPDFVEGGMLGEAMLDASGSVRRWHKVLPAPMDERFDQAVCDWMAAVRDQVLNGNEYPNGPVIAVQVLNEGLYSDGQHPPTAYDYSESGLNFHQQRLVREGLLPGGEDILIPRALNVEGTKSVQDLVPYLHWGETQGRFLGDLYQRWANVLQAKVPVLCNLNPPWDETRGFDYWLSRIVPEKWPIHYGFTNWIGVVSHDETAFLRYLLLVKRARGVNLEENWGFSKLYDYRYRYHQIPFYQTLLALGLGATGFNVYTGVSTEAWTDDLDSMQERPYPDCAPISETGDTGEKYRALELLATFLEDNKEILLKGKQPNELTYAIYPPYSHLGAFIGEDRDVEHLGVRRPISGRQGVESFMLTCVSDKRSFGLTNVETVSVHELLDNPVLVMVGSFFLGRNVQRKLMDYVERGGRLLFFGQVPLLDDQMKPCEDLAKWLGDVQRTSRLERGEGIVLYQPENPFSLGGISETFRHLIQRILGPSSVQCATAHVFRYQIGTGAAAQDLLVVLSQLHETSDHVILVDGRKLEIRLPAKGSAMVVIGAKRVRSSLVKGISDYDKSYVRPWIRYEEHVVESAAAGDWLYQNGYETCANLRA
ncbi:beta-galactosidase [Alicyclobacillus ferrooxydans]|uniref:Glycoside hydrolase 35 catalytic domain-containing protein n=1 Tax=Alicyclobacillus ferrooxydans TaxID=471514 RepID=A0A0P9CE17_9BACL|nr:beta-galactosidase [Alicyclobacillus ferrooxydans]KPV44051.1 hypothetical protein AN477_09105 [Alicyclobacillus ferrooxydans]